MCWALNHQNILEMAQGHISLLVPSSIDKQNMYVEAKII
jgi:hypothetical protein